MTQWEEIIYDTLENYYIEMITWELRSFVITNKDTKETRSFFLNQYDFRGTSRMLYLVVLHIKSTSELFPFTKSTSEVFRYCSRLVRYSCILQSTSVSFYILQSTSEFFRYTKSASEVFPYTTANL